MKNLFVFCLSLSLLLPSLSWAQLNTHTDSISYALGSDIGKNLKNTDLPIDSEMLVQGIQDAIGDGEAKIDEATARALIQAFQREAQAAQQAKAAEQAGLNLEEARLFLEQNQTAEGVMVTPSGLQYKVVTEGTGATPTATNTVKVHYEGKLLDESIFDSSYKRGEPIEFQLNRVIKGWTEGLQLMKEGAKYILYIPPELGYGARGAGANIPPNSALIFTVELLEVK